MVIDEKRKNSKRNALLPCILHTQKSAENKFRCANGDGANVEQDKKESSSSYPDTITHIYSKCHLHCDSELRHDKVKKNSCIEMNTAWFDYLLSSYSKILSKLISQIAVVAFTIVLLSVSIYGNFQLKQEFDPYIFLPPNSSIKSWLDVHRSAFPSKGELVTIFLEGPSSDESGNLKYMNFSKFDWLVNKLQHQSDIVTSIDFWYSEYKEYYRENFQYHDFNGKTLLELDSKDLNQTIVQFLFSLRGFRYKYLFDFKHDLECGGPLPHVQVHIMLLTHAVVKNSLEGM